MSADVPQTGYPMPPVAGSQAAHDLALKRVQAKHDFEGHLVVYLAVNAFLVFVWWWSGGGYFWPGWVMAGWGIGVVIRAWEIFFRKPVTEVDVREEMRRTGLM